MRKTSFKKKIKIFAVTDFPQKVTDRKKNFFACRNFFTENQLRRNFLRKTSFKKKIKIFAVTDFPQKVTDRKKNFFVCRNFFLVSPHPALSEKEITGEKFIMALNTF